MGSALANILVNDDEPQVLQVISRILEDAGHQVMATTDPELVQAMVSDSGVDAVILDVNMPLSGFEVLNRLRDDEQTAAVPILFLSGLAGSMDRVRGLRLGADDYMVKPFEGEELLFRLNRLLELRPRGVREDRLQEPKPSSDGSEKAVRGVDVRTVDVRTVDVRKIDVRKIDVNRPDRRRDADAAPVEKRQFGRYVVLDVMGQGSMGTVYRGHDPRLERQVALKTIRLDAVRSEEQRTEMLTRLRHEAVTIARCAHPNIIAVHDQGGFETSAFIAMEIVDGLSLRDLVKQRGPLTASQAIPMALQVARGLAAAHQREVIHRDVKPGNVLLGYGGEIKVSDFGLAFVVSAMATDSTEISGTPGYVPPEVMNQNPYTEAGDVFGFGATLYESLTAVHPLAGATLRDTIMNTLNGNVQPIHDRVAGVPAELEDLVMTMLSTEPDQRPLMDDVVQALERMVRQGELSWDAPRLPQPHIAAS